jgi:hypothetical protein
LDIHVRIDGPKAFGPQRHQVIQGIRTNAVQSTGDPTNTFVARQIRIDLYLSPHGSYPGK